MNDREVYGSDIQLPSLGKPYGLAVPDGWVRVVPMTTKEEKLMSGSNPTQGLTGIDIIIERCTPTLAEAGIKPDDLTTSDRIFLLVMIRTVTYGGAYNISVRCSVCSQRLKHTYNFPDDIQVYYISDSYKEPFFTPPLNNSKAVVGLRLLRGRDEKMILRHTERILQVADGDVLGDPSYSYRLANHIVSIKLVDGTVLENRGAGDLGRVHAWIENLHAGDIAQIRQCLADFDSGILVESDVFCPKCNSYTQVGLPMQAEFFRPGSSRQRDIRRRSNPDGALENELGISGGDASMGTSNMATKIEAEVGKGVK